MSGVPMRLRSVSSQEFFNNALQINSDVLSLVSRDDVIPKRYRFLIAVPVAETAREVVVEINRAEAFYPSNAANVLQRKKHYNLAIAACEQLYLDIQTIIGNRKLPATASKFEDVAASIATEIKLIKGARDNTKPVRLKNRDYDEWVADAEDELARRMALRDEAASVVEAAAAARKEEP